MRFSAPSPRRTRSPPPGRSSVPRRGEPSTRGALRGRSARSRASCERRAGRRRRSRSGRRSRTSGTPGTAWWLTGCSPRRYRSAPRPRAIRGASTYSSRRSGSRTSAGSGRYRSAHRRRNSTKSRGCWWFRAHCLASTAPSQRSAVSQIAHLAATPITMVGLSVSGISSAYFIRGTLP